MNILVSAAYKTESQTSDTVGKSSIWIKKNNGSRMDPWATPPLIDS